MSHCAGIKTRVSFASQCPDAEHSRVALQHQKLDQFYTKPAVAKACWREVKQAMRALKLNAQTCWFVEPSAGCGGFYQFLPPARRTGIDIMPRKLSGVDGSGIICADYLEWRPTRDGCGYVVVGNPPFGKRGKLAVAFFNHSDFADIIAFIVPVSFRKYFIHRQLPPEYGLVVRQPLANDSFHTPDGKDYAINAEFQIWTRLSVPRSMPDMREHFPAPIKHPDFEMRQYNNTKQALPMFDAPFDFAVPCQGYQDYSRRETAPADCEKHKQWMLFTAKNDEVRGRLMAIDYATLSHNCATATPGFRKNDVVKYYGSLA